MLNERHRVTQAGKIYSYLERQEPRILSHYLYVAENGIGDMLKIGISKNVDLRMRQLTTGSGFETKCLNFAVYPSEEHARNAEKWLHIHFSEHREKGEWFKGLSVGVIKDAISEYEKTDSEDKTLESDCAHLYVNNPLASAWFQEIKSIPDEQGDYMVRLLRSRLDGDKVAINRDKKLLRTALEVTHFILNPECLEARSKDKKYEPPFEDTLFRLVNWKRWADDIGDFKVDDALEVEEAILKWKKLFNKSSVRKRRTYG